MSGGRLPRRRWGRGVLALVLGSLVWTLMVCYPNPVVFFRNFSRYRHFPLDPKIESRMHWALPEDAPGIEEFVDRELRYAPDWKTYRMPWYMPTAQEVATSLRGDCESKAVLFASLLAGRKIPFEMRASFDHIWVDYAGRKERPGETRDLAYLEGRGGRLGMHWPRTTELLSTLRVQRELLWDAMPPFRKLLWAVGLLWLALGALAWTVALPQCTLESRWWRPVWSYVLPTTMLGALTFIGLTVLPLVFGRASAIWLPVDLTEAALASGMVGAFTTWLVSRYLRRQFIAVALEPEGVVAYWRRGPLRRRRRIGAAEVRHVQLDASPGGAKPWRVAAMLRTGRLAPLLCFRKEEEARRSLRTLGQHLFRPIVVRSERMELQVDPEQIGRPLAAAHSELQTARAAEPPRSLDLVVTQDDGVWTLRYPEAGRTGRLVLLLMALVPALLFAGVTYLLTRLGQAQFLWIVWVLAGAFLAMTLYLMLVLKEEMVARLSGARIEVGDGELRFYTPEAKVERLALSDIESVEMGSKGEQQTLAIVCHDRVVHIAGFGSPEERPWVRDIIEEAIVGKIGPAREEMESE